MTVLKMIVVAAAVLALGGCVVEPYGSPGYYGPGYSGGGPGYYGGGVYFGGSDRGYGGDNRGHGEEYYR